MTDETTREPLMKAGPYPPAPETSPRAVQVRDPRTLTKDELDAMGSQERMTTLASLLFGEVLADPKHAKGWVAMVEIPLRGKWMIHVSPEGSVAESLASAQLENAALRVACEGAHARADEVDSNAGNVHAIAAELLAALERIAVAGGDHATITAELDKLRDENGLLPWDAGEEDEADHG